jgi:hypothetical protein
VREVTETGPSVFFPHRDPEQTELTERRPEVCRKAVLAVYRFGTGSDVVCGERANGLAQEVEFIAVAKIEVVHAASPIGRCAPLSKAPARG